MNKVVSDKAIFAVNKKDIIRKYFIIQKYYKYHSNRFHIRIIQSH